jgi:hypothetical protein
MKSIFTVSNLDGIFPSLKKAIAAWNAAGKPPERGSSVWVTESRGFDTVRTITLAA